MFLGDYKIVFYSFIDIKINNYECAITEDLNIPSRIEYQWLSGLFVNFAYHCKIRSIKKLIFKTLYVFKLIFLDSAKIYILKSSVIVAKYKKSSSSTSH